MVSNLGAHSFMANSTETFAERRERIRQVLSSPMANVEFTGINLWRGGKRPEPEIPTKAEPAEAASAPVTKPAMQSASLAASFYVAGCEIDDTPRGYIPVLHIRTERLSRNVLNSIRFGMLRDTFTNVHLRGGRFSENDFRNIVNTTMEALRNAYLTGEDTHGLPKDFGTTEFESRLLSKAFGMIIDMNSDGANGAAVLSSGMNPDTVGADWQFFSARHWFQEAEVRELIIKFTENFAQEMGLDCPVEEFRNSEFLSSLLNNNVGQPPFDFPEGFTPDRNFTMLYDKRNNLVRINGTRICLYQAGRMNTVDELKRFLDELGVEFGLFAAVRFLSNHFNMLTRGHNLHLDWFQAEAHQAYEAFSLSE